MAESSLPASDISGQKTAEIPKDRRRERAVSLLLSEKSVEAVARKLGVSKRTLYRWLQDESFRAEYQAAKKNLLRAATARLTANMIKATEVLSEIATRQGRAFQGPRVSAAIGIIRLALEADVIDDLESRIRKLEFQGRDSNDGDGV